MRRRTFIQGCLLCGSLTFPLTEAIAQRARPFCRFSIKDGWTDESERRYITRRAKQNDESGVPQIVARIKQVLAFQAEIDVMIAEDEDNAFATVSNGRKILVADVGFLQKLNSISRTRWGAIQVIAHEVGHHIAGFDQDRHRGELNADYWSGQTLQRLGSSEQAATSAILAVGTDVDTDSHPNKNRRAEVISKGWRDARRDVIDYSHCLSCR